MEKNITMGEVVDLIVREKIMQEHIINISNTSYRVLKNASISDVEKLIEDNNVSLFVASIKRDIEFNESDIDTYESLEKMVWDEMLENMEFVKTELMKFGLVLNPLFGQYKYEKINKLTFEHSILVPLTSSYTGYKINVMESWYGQILEDFRALAIDVCDLLGQESIIMKSPALDNKTDAAFMDKNGYVGEDDWIGRRVSKISGKDVVDYASLLMEDAEAEIPDLDIRELYRDDLRQELLDSDKWWSITSSQDGSLVNLTNSLYSNEDKGLLNSLMIRNRRI